MEKVKLVSSKNKKPTNCNLITVNSFGFSLIEPLLAAAVMGVIVILFANLPNAMGLITKSKNMSLAREITAKQLEDKRNIAFEDLAYGSTAITDSRVSLLPQGEGEVVVEGCNVVGETAICSVAEEEDVKRVTVSVNWKEGSKDQSIVLRTLVGKGGLN